MTPLRWSILLLCISANAKNITVYRVSGQSVTLECSSAGCASSVEGYTGMTLYREFKEQEEVLYYHTEPGSPDRVTPRERYENRVQTNGSLKNHTITISNLTTNDEGVYSCVYTKFPTGEVKCNVYSLFLTGVFECQSPPLVLVIIATCAISTLVTAIFTLLILPRVKQWISSRRRPTRTRQSSNDYVYEVMTKNGLSPLQAPERSEPSPYDFA